MSVSPILDELTWRGLIHQTTDREQMREHLSQPRSVYAGFDPTATSLHVGSLLPLMMLRRFQRAGHRPIALVGGATGMIGDPSGKSEERVLLSADALAENVAGIRRQVEQFLDFDGSNPAMLVNNLDWMGGWSYIHFLRDVGKNFPVNVMLAKDSVKSRLERDDGGLSYTEFSYMLLQAYDFAYLSQNLDCTLQIGGSDQWGNMTAGIDLARRMYGKQLYVLTCPLLLSSDGRKMGKTEAGALWLDAGRTSPYAFFQYWLNVSDADVLQCIRFLTEIDQDEFRQLEQNLAQQPEQRAAQKRLASWLTEFIHGPTGLESAQRASEYLFGAEISDLTDAQLMEIFGDVPSGTVTRAELDAGVPIIDAPVRVGLCKSKSESRRSLEQGGVYVNNRRVDSAETLLTAADLASQSAIVLRVGKKRFAVLKIEG